MEATSVKVNEAMQKLSEALETCQFSHLTHEDFEYIPKFYLLQCARQFINKFWDKLPPMLKNDPEIQLHLRCFEHPYNEPWMLVHHDGPRPLRKQCRHCQRVRVLQSACDCSLCQCAVFLSQRYSPVDSVVTELSG